MEEFKRLSDDVIEQIKDFDHRNLTEEQKSLIDKLISDEELKERYKCFGLCDDCKQPNTGNLYLWCQCNFQQNFKNWTSGNDDVDKFIQKTQLKAKAPWYILEWIEHDRFENIEYLAEGGFGTVYKAIWKDGPIHGCENYLVALKLLHNSQNNTTEFIREVELHNVMARETCIIVRCYGITKDPKTNNFMIVMEYALYGSLRQHLNNNFNSLSWTDKLYNLWSIAFGLKLIHEKGLIHRDFHCGNILNNKGSAVTKFSSRITDLGLCKPANSQSEDKQIYGVLPYVAPEVLKGKEYTQASDIYGFGIIAFELCTGLPPYHDISHDEFLAIKICNGLRPKSNYKVPKLILKIIKQCWDADPLKRPKAKELMDLFSDLWKKNDKRSIYGVYEENSTINNQIKEADEINEKLPSSTTTSSSISTLSYTTHAQAVYTSRLLNFKNLPEPKNSDDNDNSFETEYSESTRIDFTKLNMNFKSFYLY